MATTMYLATQFAHQEITRAFDLVWALDVGLWNLRTTADQYFRDHPEANNREAQDAIVKGLTVHGLNLKRISSELSWAYEEQYIAQLLLINAIAIFDTWVDDYIDSVLLACSNNQKTRIAAAGKQGEFSTLDSAISQEAHSALAGYFHCHTKKQDMYIENLRLVYKYFKSCRNCCAHGNRMFSDVAERNYNAIKSMTKADCGLNEFPKIVAAVNGAPLELILRGVVGFYDVMIRIVDHYDAVAADLVSIENELIKRWCSKPYVPSAFGPQTRMNSERYHKKRNNSIRYHLKDVGMCPPFVAKTDEVYNLLVANNKI